MAFKIDLHVHSIERSGCAKVNDEYQIRAAQRAGLSGLAFTDHNKLVPPAWMAALRKAYAPFCIYTGIEVDADHEHWLVLGVDDPRLEQNSWTYPELHAFVRQQGGFLALAHPFRYRKTIQVDLDRFPPDGVELRSFNTSPQSEPEIRAIAARLRLALLNNTDAHFEGQVGTYYNELPTPARGDQELLKILAELKAG